MFCVVYVLNPLYQIFVNLELVLMLYNYILVCSVMWCDQWEHPESKGERKNLQCSTDQIKGWDLVSL